LKSDCVEQECWSGEAMIGSEPVNFLAVRRFGGGLCMAQG